jgi:hypothetical protein
VSVSVEPGEKDLAAGRIELSQDYEQVQIIAFRSADPELQPHAANQFNRLIESARENRFSVSTGGPVLHLAFGSGRFFLQTGRIRAEIEQGWLHRRKWPAERLAGNRHSGLPGALPHLIDPVIDVA